MDEIDLELSLLLMKNSRTPYRELADEVDLSVNAVHSRVQNMVERDIIQEFYSKISLRAFKGVTVVSVEGQSETGNVEELIERVGKNEDTFKVISASGNYLYVHGLLRDVTEMNDYVDYVKKEAEMRDPDIFMPDMKDFEPLDDFDFSKLDYRIIVSMHKDSKKALSEVADELNVSAKTVRRRINRMEKAGAVDFGIKLRPTQSSDFISFFEFETKPDYDRKRVKSRIRKRYYPKIYAVFAGSNVPNRLVANVWTKSLDGIHELKEDLRKEGYFDSIVSRIYYNGKEFDTWRDDFLIEKADA